MVELDSIEKGNGNISLLFSVDRNDWEWLEKEIKLAGLEMNTNEKENFVKVEINDNELLFWTR